MTVEQALEARALLAEQAKNQIAKMEHITATDPEAVDPEILAQAQQGGVKVVKPDNKQDKKEHDNQ